MRWAWDTTLAYMATLLADSILVVHFLFIAFVLLGQAGIVVGGIRHWGWVRRRRFRLLHLGAIAFVVLQSWAGVLCPLTVWENALRLAAGKPGYSETFVGHWLGKLVYFDVPAWVFITVYTVFGLVVLACWFIVKPEKLRKRPHGRTMR